MEMQEKVDVMLDWVKSAVPVNDELEKELKYVIKYGFYEVEHVEHKERMEKFELDEKENQTRS